MPLYAATILISAFLLFAVQPMVARVIVPWFGGSAAVWSTCMVFFQVVLLLGYLYSHLLVRYLKPRLQAILHVVLLASSALLLPVYPSAAWKPNASDEPALRILALLAATVGLPYFLLSTTGPLLQAWYTRSFKGAIPYRLYALSNLGSLAALLGYPVLIEPALQLRQQAMWWSAGYAAFGLLAAAAAFHFARRPDYSLDLAPAAVPAPTRSTLALWLGLPAISSLLLVSVTEHVTQNIAAIPLLWVLPLAVYLISFILAFDRASWYRRRVWLPLAAAALAGMAYFDESDGNPSLFLLLPLFILGLFAATMVCHGELARLKPAPARLTLYYVLIALGGALGSSIAGLVAPLCFNGLYELPIALAACALLIVYALLNDSGALWFRTWRQPAPAFALVFTLVLTCWLSWQFLQDAQHNHLMVRNFYGALRTRDDGPAGGLNTTRSLMNGTITHGSQFLHSLRQYRPTTYYTPGSGIGMAIADRRRKGALRVGVVGLGAGTLAAYAREGDYYRFYEINPLVIDIARREFTFLSNSKAKIEISPGDARLTMERQAPAEFDVLAIDAFSGDSVPVHLLTREAFELYFRHLDIDGILAVHVSSRYVRIDQVVRLAAQALRKEMRVVSTESIDRAEQSTSIWLLLVNDTSQLRNPLFLEARLRNIPGLRLWTDQYSSLLPLLQ